MVATLRKLHPPRALRWVIRYRWYGIGLIAVALLIGLLVPRWWMWLFSITMIGFGVWSLFVAQHRSRIVGEGSEGEALTAKVLDNMQMDARVLHSVQFESGDKTRELDHVLITHSALFVIETKYLRGRIAGAPDDREWTLHKRARKTRSRYKRAFYNPLKQVATQIYHLRSHLELNLDPRWADECRHIWIQGVVVFSHPQGDASSVVNHQLGVVQLENLQDFLRNYRPPSRAGRLSYGLRREISRILAKE
jgi:hypothetical protein